MTTETRALERFFLRDTLQLINSIYAMQYHFMNYNEHPNPPCSQYTYIRITLLFPFIVQTLGTYNIKK